ncbi:MAG: DUF1653 domain-containing protein [Acetatifactor sp.]|nr:DUF1653 domain-containing protein [Acetatifactor sp.]
MAETTTFLPKVHEIYKHFKGNLYQITAIAEHTETGEILVIYQAMYGEFKTYARPLSMFISRVDREKYPEVTQEFRFELQGPEAERQRAALGVPSGAAADRKAAFVQEKAAADLKETFVQEKAVADRKAASAKEKEKAADQGTAEGEFQLDPGVLEFLDADSYEEKLNILAGLHHRITDHMLTTMAISCDIEVGEGDIEERYSQLRNCLLTLQKYECKRLR